MSSPKFQVGDVVILNSGGPRMTVSVVEDTSKGFMLTCQWLDDDGALANHRFHEATVYRAGSTATPVLNTRSVSDYSRE